MKKVSFVENLSAYNEGSLTIINALYEKLLIAFLAFLSCASLRAQVDEHGNPVFNSVEIEETYLDEFDLVSGYYTIHDNISDRKSSKFVSESPSLSDYIDFALNQPAYFFMVRRDLATIGIIVLSKDSPYGFEGNYFKYFTEAITTPYLVPCSTSGDITEHRALELDSFKIDPSSKIVNTEEGKYLQFDGSKYLVQSYDLIKNEALKIAAKINSGVPLPQPEANPVEYVKRESINGGALDIVEELNATGEYSFKYHNIYFNKQEFAILIWAKRVKRVGIKNAEEATKLWEEIYKKKLIPDYKKLLVLSFDNKPLR